MKLPPAGAGGIFWLQAKNELEPFGLPLHHQTGVWCFMWLNKKGQNKKIIVLLSYSVLLPERFFLRN